MTTITDHTGHSINIEDGYTFKVVSAQIDIINLTALIDVRFTNGTAINVRTFYIITGIDGNVNGSIEDAAKELISSENWYDNSKYEI